ncbi:unnamed protein product [Schistosoma turkestanicum]|nr:unnamed protein product [Schistosoma turkestanicum]
MTGVIPNLSTNEKPKQTLLDRLKLVQRYFSNPTLHLIKSHNNNNEKPPKHILSHQSPDILVVENNSTSTDTFHAAEHITSPKLLQSRRNTNNWTIKQFKKHIKLTRPINKHQHKSATLSVEPTRECVTSDSYNLQSQYHTLKESSLIHSQLKQNSNNLDEISITNRRSIDEVSSQSISTGSINFDDCLNEQVENGGNFKTHLKITNLDDNLESDDDDDDNDNNQKLNSENITATQLVNEILKESGVDKSWTIIDHRTDNHHRHQQQQRKQSLSNVQFSMSDIYSIFAGSHDDKLNDVDYSMSLMETSNPSKYFQSLSSSDILTKTYHKHGKKLSLVKCNIFRLKRCLNISTKSKTLPTVQINEPFSEKSK